MSTYKPYGDRVIIRPKDPRELRSGRIVVPDMGDEKANYGEIIAVGPGNYTFSGVLIPMVSKVGDVVFYPTFGSQKINIDGEELICCEEKNLYTAIEK